MLTRLITLFIGTVLIINLKADDWPMLGHDAGRSGSSPDDLRPPFVRKWHRLFPDEGIQSGVQPVIANGKVFLGTLAGVMHAMDADSGKEIWTFKTSGPILHTAAASDNRVFFGSADGSVYALDAHHGNAVWRKPTGSAIWNAPAIHKNLVFIGSRDGILYALESDSGRAHWTANLGAPVLNSPAVDVKKGRVYIGSEAMHIYAFDIATGRQVWKSEQLPGASFRGYHPVIAPDGSVMVTTQPVMGYDRFQSLLMDMAKDVFGDIASWRHKADENKRLRQENFELLKKPETYTNQLQYLLRRLKEEPAYQTFFVLDPETGKQRFIAPIVASESMNGPGAPPLVTPDGKVIVKYQVVLRSRYEHYSPFLNVGYLNTATGHITPIMDQSRTYGWHDSLLLVHDEQCQLSVAGRMLLNTHQDNVNAMDLITLKGETQPLALNVHEPARGEALAIRWAVKQKKELPPGLEWLIRGTAIYGGGSVLDVPVTIAGDSFYYLPTHELNSGCALIAYRMQKGAPAQKKTALPIPVLSENEWQQIQNLPWDWDALATPRLTNLLAALPGTIPGTTASPLVKEAQEKALKINDQELDEFIWKPAFDPALSSHSSSTSETTILNAAVEELLSRKWRPWVIPAAKAPEEAYRYFNDPLETIHTLLLARPFLKMEVQDKVDKHITGLLNGELNRSYEPTNGESRVPYEVPVKLMRIVDESKRDGLNRLYPLWLWTQTIPGSSFLTANWSKFRPLLREPAPKIMDDCGNGRLAGLFAYCRMAKKVGDTEALNEALPIARQAMRQRLVYEFAHTRGGVSRVIPNGRSVFVRWRRLTPDVGHLLSVYAGPIQKQLVSIYVDHHRPGWWLAWNVEQLVRNEVPFQLPSTPLEIFSARALILKEPASHLRQFVDLPWCRADEYYIQKLAIVLYAEK